MSTLTPYVGQRVNKRAIDMPVPAKDPVHPVNTLFIAAVGRGGVMIDTYLFLVNILTTDTLAGDDGNRQRERILTAAMGSVVEKVEAKSLPFSFGGGI